MKVAIVTGGSSGMGEATVQELEKRGWKVAAMARSAHEFKGDAETLRGYKKGDRIELTLRAEPC